MSNNGQFTFDTKYQRRVLALAMQEYDFLVFIAPILEPSAFETKVLKWFYTTILNYYLDYQMRPTQDVIRNEVKKAFQNKIFSKDDLVEVKRVYNELKAQVLDKSYLIGEVQKFMRHQAFKHAMQDIIPLMKTGDLDDAEEIMLEALKVGKGSLDIGVQYFTDYKERIKRRLIEFPALPTGIPVVDAHLKHGGLGIKQYGVLLGPPGFGKTMALVHIGKAGIVRKKKVVHITLEMPADSVAERYDVSWTGEHTIHGKLFKNLNRMSNSFGNSLIIKEFPSGSLTVAMLDAYLNALESTLDFKAELLIVDYVDIMAPKRLRKEKRLELGDIHVDLRGLGQRRGLYTWTAAQTNREALTKKTITIKDFGESFEPAKHSDLVLALCQTPEELELEQMRLYFAKNRHKKDKFAVSIRTAYSRNQFAVAA